MKKLLGIVVLGLLWCNFANANILELEKCVWGLSKPSIKITDTWTKEYFEKHTTSYLGIIKPYSWKTKDGTEWRNLKGFGLSNDNGWWNKVTKLELLIQGFQKTRSAKNIYSINGSSGIITELWEQDEVYFNLVREANAKLEKFLISEDLYDDYAKKWMKEKTKHWGDIREITKYQIADFVGDLIYAHEIDEDNLRYPPDERFGILIDLKKMTIKHGMMKHIDQPISYNFKICTTSDASGPDQSGPSSGTAFFISNKGYMLTNNHVVEGCEVSKINYFNKEYDTELISTDKTLDLALLKVNLRPKSYISFSNKEARKRQQVVIAGYPLGKGLSDDLKINDGRISSVKGFENNTNEVTVDIAINPGNSGGPIVNEKGQLVAIAVSGLSKEITEGLNFGIKASAASNFLKSNKIRPGTGNFNFSMNDDKLVELLEESTVYIFCNNFESFASVDNKSSGNFIDDKNLADIKEFKIEGIKLGDSALDYFSKDELDQGILDTDNGWNRINLEDKDNDFYKIYNSIIIHIKANDPNYIIHEIGGNINFIDTFYNYDENQCFNRMDKIINYIEKKLNFKKTSSAIKDDLEHQGAKYSRRHYWSVKSDSSNEGIHLANKIYMHCNDYASKYWDSLRFSIRTKEKEN